LHAPTARRPYRRQRATALALRSAAAAVWKIACRARAVGRRRSGETTRRATAPADCSCGRAADAGDEAALHRRTSWWGEACAVLGHEVGCVGGGGCLLESRHHARGRALGQGAAALEAKLLASAAHLHAHSMRMRCSCCTPSHKCSLRSTVNPFMNTKSAVKSSRGP